MIHRVAWLDIPSQLLSSLYKSLNTAVVRVCYQKGQKHVMCYHIGSALAVVVADMHLQLQHADSSVEKAELGMAPLVPEDAPRLQDHMASLLLSVDGPFDLAYQFVGRTARCTSGRWHGVLPVALTYDNSYGNRTSDTQRQKTAITKVYTAL